MLLALLASCISPVAYGAVPDDRGDDSKAFQQAAAEAIAQHAELCVPAGVWNLEKRAGQIGSVELTGGPIAIRGAGAKTVLRMSGPGHRRDWRALRFVDAHDVVIRDLTIDGLDAYDSEEQTHLVELAPGTHDVVISNVTFGPMRRPDQKVGDGIGGDCIRMLGEPGREVADVTIADARFVDCDRSAIGFQRALRDITVARVAISGTGDTAVDFEPTGRGAIDDVALVDLTVQHPPEAQSAWAITLSGIDQDLANRVLVERSTLEGGGIGMLNVARVVVSDNVITAHPKMGPKPTISVIRRGTDIRISRNTITRPASADPGFVIRASHNNGSAPRDIVIEDNTITQATAHAVIGAISSGGFVVRHNVIDYTAANRGIAIVEASATIADIDGLTVEDNEVRGAAGSLVTASRRQDHRVATVVMRNNRTEQLAGLRCNGSAGMSSISSDRPMPEAAGCGAAQVLPIAVHPNAAEISRNPPQNP